MLKIISFYILIFSFCFVPHLFAQGNTDTLLANSSDSASGKSTESEISAVSESDSLYQPVADSLNWQPRQVREVPAQQVNRYKKNPEYAYANDPDYWRREPVQEPGLLFRILFSRVFHWILLTIITGLVLYGIYQLAKENNFGLLIRNRNPDTGNLPENSPDQQIDFDEAIGRSQEEGNYRMATRYLYLRLIHVLRDKSGIHFRDSSTNAEITLALGNHPQAVPFRKLATAYEYIFYGGFVPSREMYDLLKNKFETVQKSFVG